MEKQAMEKQAITAMRVLTAEAIQKAKSGHPGLAIGSAPTGYTLFKHMKHNPADPRWDARDRFVLSSGHASMLLYTLLHFYGYGLSMEDIANFRQLGSRCPGHPEYHEVPGAEATTGPLGQGFAMAVGMAMAEAHQAAVYNREDFPIVDNYTYVLMGDGCMMEGVSHEAASLAGHMKLHKLIAFYDSNRITIEGGTDIAFTEDVHKRFEAYGWQVLEVMDGEDTAAIAAALEKAQADKEHPSLIIVHTVIGYGTPRAGSAKVHGEPLGEENVQLMKENLGWKYPAFTVPQELYAHFDALKKSGEAAETQWKDLFARYEQAYPELAARYKAEREGKLPDFAQDPAYWEFSPSEASRSSSGTVLNRLAAGMPNLLGGSADLAPSTKTELKGLPFMEPGCYEGRNIHFGVRELAMACACNGMALYGGLRVFCATFFVFSDYVKPALRLSAIMKLPVLYVLTHDSIGVGEDGPTHQPIEQLAMLRAVPNTLVFRPADGRETAAGYLAALQHEGPTCLALSRQNLPQLEGSGLNALKGAYILREPKGTPDVILMGSGSEVELLFKAADRLAVKGYTARIVSVPSFELFEQQSEEYKQSILPDGIRARVAVEAGASFGWGRYVGLDGETVCIDHFGASGPYKEVFPAMGFTAEKVDEAAMRTIEKCRK